MRRSSAASWSRALLRWISASVRGIVGSYQYVGLGRISAIVVVNAIIMTAIVGAREDAARAVPQGGHPPIAVALDLFYVIHDYFLLKSFIISILISCPASCDDSNRAATRSVVAFECCRRSPDRLPTRMQPAVSAGPLPVWMRIPLKPGTWQSTGSHLPLNLGEGVTLTAYRPAGIAVRPGTLITPGRSPKPR